MTDRVMNKSSIWDLHIHTCNSPKSNDEFQKMEVDEYIDKLIDIFSDYPDLSLISFTDHNLISYEVYEKFSKKCSSVRLIPGIEIDVKLENIADSKHMLFYFNIEIEKLENFAKKINKYLEDNKEPNLNQLLDFLIANKIEFLISPHAFKQGRKGINYDWNDEDKAGQNAHKYMDQFFNFWEASGASEIAKANEFLIQIEKNERISVISFSDSSNEKKLRKYLSNPPQYFMSLPNYRGIQLAGTDCRRILKEKKLMDNGAMGDIIGSIRIQDEEIELSDRLNAIVGGRGSGKSVLLDRTALDIDSSIKQENKLEKGRIDFLDTIDIELKNIDGSHIMIDSKKIDYFHQAYVSKIFNSENTSEEIEKQFSEEFKCLEPMNKSLELQTIKTNFSLSTQGLTTVSPTSNISDFICKYKIIKQTDLGIGFLKKDIKELKKIEYNIDSAVDTIKTGSKIIPAELKSNKRINNALLDFIKIIEEETNKKNIERIEQNLSDIIKKKCVDYSENKNAEVKLKNETEKLFLEHLDSKYSLYINRVKIVRAILMLQSNYKKEKNVSNIINGIDNDKFKFEKKIVFEEPQTYFKRKCAKYMGQKYMNYSFEELSKEFIYNLQELIKDTKTNKEFIKELEELNDYQVTEENNIYYKKDDQEFENVSHMSPGTQTNVLMEYIVSKNTTIPLLIDQPEDNIDNETIYTKLTDWFAKLKLKRQVIVVTHDANIVINADAENIIIASKNENGIFEYSYGALEYKDVLEKISVILDGGIEAVERRLKKYGR